jgi:hypothetical protein
MRSMGGVLRRCLDCDCTFAVSSACPRCASTKVLILDDGGHDDQAFARSGSWLAIAHALALTLATRQQPGSVLGTLLFGIGLGGILVLLEVEMAPRIARSCAAMLMLVEIIFAIATGQALLFAPAALMALAGLLLLHPDPSAGWLPAVRLLGWAACLVTVALTAAPLAGLHPPGWWVGRYLPWNSLAPQADPDAVTAPAPLPGGRAR